MRHYAVALRHGVARCPGSAMELAELHVFLTVASERSFSRAAAKLHRTQPAVSQAIRRLEGTRRLAPEELAKLWGDTMGKEPKAPWGTAFGRTLNERPANEWKEVEKGVRAWKWGYGEP